MDLDLTERLRRHIEYSRKRDAHAKAAIELLGRGDDVRGMKLARKAEYWDRMVKAMERG